MTWSRKNGETFFLQRLDYSSIWFIRKKNTEQKINVGNIIRAMLMFSKRKIPRIRTRSKSGTYPWLWSGVVMFLLWFSVGFVTDESEADLLRDSAPSDTELLRPTGLFGPTPPPPPPICPPAPLLLPAPPFLEELKVLPGELEMRPSMSSR